MSWRAQSRVWRHKMQELWWSSAGLSVEIDSSCLLSFSDTVVWPKIKTLNIRPLNRTRILNGSICHRVVAGLTSSPWWTSTSLYFLADERHWCYSLLWERNAALSDTDRVGLWGTNLGLPKTPKYLQPVVTVTHYGRRQGDQLVQPNPITKNAN